MAETISDLNDDLRAVRQRYLKRCRDKLAAASEWEPGELAEDASKRRKLAKSAHDLASSGATLGFREISEIVARLERASSDRGEESVDPLFDWQLFTSDLDLRYYVDGVYM